MTEPANPTTLLPAWGRGDQAALDRLLPLIHDELRRLARRHIARERVGHTLQATALVNEAYLRLIQINQVLTPMTCSYGRAYCVGFARGPQLSVSTS